MGQEFTEVALARSLYLRIELPKRELGNRLNLRPETCLTPFPLYGNLYHILKGETLENPTGDIVNILTAQKSLYQNLSGGIEALEKVVNPGRYGSERALDEVKIQAQKIFFKDQLARLSDVEHALGERIDHYNRNNWNRGNEAFDYAKVFSEVQAAVVSFHRDVLTAAYSFDKLVVGTKVKPEEKFGEEPYVRNPLEKAIRALESLSTLGEVSVSEKRREWRKKQLVDIFSEIRKNAEQIQVALKDVSPQ